MPTADRRHTPRTKLDQLAYIHIEPDNGAIVLNASGEGLGFHSMAPIERDGPLRFSVQEQNRRIDIAGELVWTDEIQKIGGVRFNSLTPEARDQIANWVRNADGAAGRSTLGAALLKALPVRASTSRARRFGPALAWWKSGRRLKVSGFARGLASGFVLSLLAFSVVLLSYAHRRELGESLVRMGERLGANRESGVPLRSAPPPAVLVSSPELVKTGLPAETTSASMTTPVKHEITSATEKPIAAHPVVAETASAGQRTQPISPNADPPKPKTSQTKLSGKSTGAGQGPTVAPAVAPPSINAVVLPFKSAQPLNSYTDQLLTLVRSETVVPLAVGFSPPSSRSDVQMFFDLGRFKKDWVAEQLRDKVAQLGIHATVMPRGHLWMSSYQVLAGPYDNEAAETAIKNQLLAQGYNPRPYERGTRDFSFHSRVSIDRSRLPTGDLSIEWESYLADTKVKFKQGRYLVAAVDGEWVKHRAKFSNNEYVYQVQHDGSRPLLEIHFAGMDRSLVLRNLR